MSHFPPFFLKDFSQHLFHGMFSTFCHKDKSIYAPHQRELSLLIMIEILFYVLKKLNTQNLSFLIKRTYFISLFSLKLKHVQKDISKKKIRI